MPSSSAPTRERLLDAAQEAINQQGFAATSVDRIIAAAGVTKGAFFHHFPSKNELARALIERFAAADRQILEGNMARAEKLADDPLQQLLVFVGLMIEVAEELDATPQPGCLFATFCYERGLFDEATTGVVGEAIESWRETVGAKLREAAAAHPPVVDVDLDSLADAITIVFEGAFVVARSTDRESIFADQLRHYRTYLQLLFGAAG